MRASDAFRRLNGRADILAVAEGEATRRDSFATGGGIVPRRQSKERQAFPLRSRSDCATLYPMSDATRDPPPDVAILCGPTEDQQGTRILRAREGAIEAGEVRPARDGQPLAGQELVRLRPRVESPLVCDVEVLYSSRDSASSKDLDRPAQVATDEYRRNWDRIFGSEPESPQKALLN